MEHKEVKKSASNKDKTSLLVTALRRHRLGFLIIMVMAGITSVFAWFIYNTAVDFGIEAHVKAWNIHIGDDGEGTAMFTLRDIYPGVTPTSFDSLTTCNEGMDYCVSITNSGELSATSTLTVKEFYLFGELQTLNTDYTLDGPDVNGIYTISGDYPFSIRFKVSSVSCSGGVCQTLLAPGASVSLFFSFEWVYERDAASYALECPTTTTHSWCTTYDTYLDYYDDLDTQLGERAYEFKTNPPAGAAYNKDLVIILKMDFTQSTP